MRSTPPASISPRRIRTLLMAALFAAAALSPLAGKDAFVMLSGGDSPLLNNYSQYLQARAMVDYFQRTYPRDSVWVFFGAGNTNADSPFFFDVRKKLKKEGVTYDTWLPGVLPQNRPAKKSVILKAFRDEILPTIAGGGTLYLFVGDHGSRTRGLKGESIMNLWELDPAPGTPKGWKANNSETLSVSELRDVIAQGAGKGRVIFCMTQCHSGGFHYLAVPREVALNPRWFTTPSPPNASRDFQVCSRVAGFTATDEMTPAAGCDPDPDPRNWAGYERFIPEHLLGIDLFTLQPSKPKLRSFAEAHVAATLVDGTIDHPYSTSEQYLERWAEAIEKRLLNNTNLAPRVRRQMAAYQRTVDGAAPATIDRAMRERHQIFQKFIQQMAQQNPSTRSLLTTGTRKQLEEAIRSRQFADGDGPAIPTAQADNSRRGRRMSESRKQWKQVILPAWRSAFDAMQLVPSAARNFEKHIQQHEQEGKDFILADADLMADEVFWQSGYSKPSTLDAAKAEAIAIWAEEREAKILAWAKKSGDETVRGAAEKLDTGSTPAWMSFFSRGNAGESRNVISRKIAAERTLFYRRVIAAWEFLLAVNERPALDRIRELTELERKPLPSPRNR